MKRIIGFLAACATLAISSSAIAWSIEGKIDIVDMRDGGYNSATSFVYVAPKNSLPSYRWLIVNNLDRCDNLSTSALITNATVIFQGSGSCATSGTIRRCDNVVTRCLIYRNR